MWRHWKQAALIFRCHATVILPQTAKASQSEALTLNVGRLFKCGQTNNKCSNFHMSLRWTAMEMFSQANSTCSNINSTVNSFSGSIANYCKINFLWTQKPTPEFKPKSIKTLSQLCQFIWKPTAWSPDQDEFLQMEVKITACWIVTHKLHAYIFVHVMFCQQNLRSVFEEELAISTHICAACCTCC